MKVAASSRQMRVQVAAGPAGTVGNWVSLASTAGSVYLQPASAISGLPADAGIGGGEAPELARWHAGARAAGEAEAAARVAEQLAAVPFPPKRLVGSQGAAVLEERQQLLAAWLNTALQLLPHAQPLNDFLQVCSLCSNCRLSSKVRPQSPRPCGERSMHLSRSRRTRCLRLRCRRWWSEWPVRWHGFLAGTAATSSSAFPQLVVTGPFPHTPQPPPHKCARNRGPPPFVLCLRYMFVRSPPPLSCAMPCLTPPAHCPAVKRSLSKRFSDFTALRVGLLSAPPEALRPPTILQAATSLTETEEAAEVEAARSAASGAAISWWQCVPRTGWRTFLLRGPWVISIAARQHTPRRLYAPQVCRAGGGDVWTGGRQRGAARAVAGRAGGGLP